MDKDQLLAALSMKIALGEITREEVLAHLPEGTPADIAAEYTTTSALSEAKSHFSMTKLFYTIGGAVVVIGLVALAAQIWEDVGSGGRIILTLGFGLVFAGIGAMLTLTKRESNLGTVFHAIGGLLIPGGAMVTMYEINPSNITEWSVAITFGLICVVYLLLAIAQKLPVLTFFGIANGTIALYALIAALLKDTSLGYSVYEDIYAFVTMAVGASYLAFAHAFVHGWNNRLTNILLFVGSAAFLIAAFTRVFDSPGWTLLYFAVIALGLGISILMQSRIILINTTLALLAHVAYITGEYFADSIGWPVALVVLGLMFIGLGYASISINARFIKRTPAV